MDSSVHREKTEDGVSARLSRRNEYDSHVARQDICKDVGLALSD